MGPIVFESWWRSERGRHVDARPEA